MVNFTLTPIIQFISGYFLLIRLIKYEINIKSTNKKVKAINAYNQNLNRNISSRVDCSGKDESHAKVTACPELNKAAININTIKKTNCNKVSFDIAIPVLQSDNYLPHHKQMIGTD